MSKKDEYIKRLESILETYRDFQRKAKYNDLSDLPKEDRKSLVTTAQAFIFRTTSEESFYARELKRIIAEKPALHSHTSEVMGIVASLKNDLESGALELDADQRESLADPAGVNILDLKLKLGVLEFIVAALFALCFTLIFAIIKILGLEIYWSALWPYLLMFFGLAFSGMYIVLPTIQISRKVGPNVKDIYNEFILEFSGKSKLGKIKTVGSILLGIAAVISLLVSLLPYLDKYL
ncbi:MAG TPA: hypothetical protein VNM40_02080 [Candidatus Paceibacterota bacterium]|nr:hypothetical protein [Candidatus Paceibacterota bacterium]